ncbi:class I SAM-dependent methyltransferase [Peribacillus kribbensis]|uniref:class I SAM-dependent methyltransferase n=1 Tax=Peribacillus kribbensis TaxID=356658 RepID=UPI0003FF0716|nr:class I SAM-dependent methyltransferase [Peribacillus kribbensis]
MKEHYFDKLLNIKTEGDQRGFNSSLHYHRYEPTPYGALAELFHSYEVKSTDSFVDFGCGKGRLNFYVHHFFQASATGIEMNEEFYREAVKNRDSYFKKKSRYRERLQFLCCLAEEYEIQPADNRFYLFNPFSVQVFMKVVQNILKSVEEFQRNVELILYYPADDYVFYLEESTSFTLKKEVRLEGVYEHNPYEKFMIYQLSY